MATSGDPTRTVRWRAAMRWRSVTRTWRALPDFLVLGGQRCGSTSLFQILSEHPQVLAPSHKELHHFDRPRHGDLSFYRRAFPLRAQLAARARRLSRPVITGEATTYYLFHPAVPGRVARALADASLVAILRDPVDRAYSHYQLSVRGGREALPFEEALDAEAERLAGEEARLAADPAYDSYSHRYHSYVTRGLYLPQLERWHASFPRDRLLVLRSEDLFERPHEAVGAVTAFLGLDPHPGPLPAARNRAVYERLAPATRERLRHVFAGPNERLEAYLGRELGWQRPAGG
ncbi:MAG: sulfotransferase domain-containing protein [Thermoleophilia bacterium]|nr:sulfotransferase domain-containing protein [Thermoleophilia bacterium]